jgi:hypothetical protein
MFNFIIMIACQKKPMIQVVVKNNSLQLYFQSSCNVENSKLIISTQT